MGGVLYKQIDVWKRSADGRVHCYRCFETIPGGQYCVQSCDTYDSAVVQSRRPQMDYQHIELLLEDSPDVCGKLYRSVEEAIAAFDKGFGNND
jgi:hypothetical protein